MKRLKFCFFGEIAGALNGKTVGGAQVQIALLAKALALKGHEVVIIDPFTDKGFQTPEGVKLITVPGWNKGLPGLRMFTNRLPALYKLFVKQKADFYYVRTRAYVHLASYLAAKKVGAKFIQAVASDIDVMKARDKYRHEYKGSLSVFRYLSVNLPSDLVFQYLLRKADFVLLQHRGQNQNLSIAEGKVAVFANIIDSTKVPRASGHQEDYFIHVGSLTMLKGAGNLDELSNLIDKSCALMVVGQANDGKSVSVLKKLGSKENIVLKGRQTHTDTLQLISKARALINTSNYEGFPNIFLEAWASGVPVISLHVNPGNVFDNQALGICCHGHLQQMKEAMEEIHKRPFDREALVSYVCTHHDFKTAAERFLRVLNVKTEPVMHE